MSEMVDKVARAIRAQIVKDYADGGAWTDAQPDDGFGPDLTWVNIDGHVDLTKFARAAIKAMREPLEHMILMADRKADAAFGNHDDHLDPRTAWQTMIDEALEP